MIHDRNTGPTVMTEAEKVKTFSNLRPAARPVRAPSETLETKRKKQKKKTYLIKALREKNMSSRVWTFSSLRVGVYVARIGRLRNIRQCRRNAQTNVE